MDDAISCSESGAVMLAGAHRELADFGKSRYGFEDNAPVSALLEWDDPDPSTLKPVSELFAETQPKSLYVEMLEGQKEERQAKLMGDEGEQ